MTKRLEIIVKFMFMFVFISLMGKFAIGISLPSVEMYFILSFIAAWCAEGKE